MKLKRPDACQAFLHIASGYIMLIAARDGDKFREVASYRFLNLVSAEYRSE